MKHLIERIRQHGSPLAPLPTETEPSLKELAGIRAVLFDVYGTLLISASGDIGLDSGEHRSRAVERVFAELGIPQQTHSAAQIVGYLEQAIRDEHQRSKDQGIAHPEVEIREIWRQVLDRVGYGGEVDLSALALAFELQVNPTWPMPGAKELLGSLRDAGRVMGIVSNAQFFTPLLFPSLLEQSLSDWGFLDELSYFSFAHRQAKPGTYLYEQAADRLAALGIPTQSALYVGNDMLNDVMAAQRVGFRTALFAGDARSLRWRESDPRVADTSADIVVTDLRQLLTCLSL